MADFTMMTLVTLGSGFCAFGPLMKQLGGQKFETEQKGVTVWLFWHV
jgi:hypothetical protein